MEFGRVLDRYTMRARLLPALFVALPLGLATLAWFPSGILGWGAVWGLVTWGGGTMLLAQLGRDAGKRKEPGLFQLWGGKPTTRRLRHGGTANRVLLARRHTKLSALTGLVMPSAAEEAANPSAADEVYEACGAFLRDRTRDRKLFDLIFDENCNYGFRRNLWAMKPLALPIALVALAAIIVLPMLDTSVRESGRLGLVLLTGGVNLLIVLGWLFLVRPAWVQVPAEAYAERLLDASERL